MVLTSIDWAVIIAYFVISLGVGLYFSKRAGKSLEEYFVSGRSFPWWIAGTSMVATTFAADTPLAVTGLVIKYGLAGNWFWWAFALGGMLTVFIFARLWRRSGIITDVELTELRYGGKPAAFLRGFRAVYLAIPINCIIIGWVTGAMLKVLKITVLGENTNDWLIIFVLLGVTGIYTVLSGMWGVAITDFIQFIMAMGGCIALAVLAVNEVGGAEALHEKVAMVSGGGSNAFSFFPDFTSAGWMTLEMFLVYIFILWWASWYPGAEPGGGGYVVQRMASCKSEKDSLLATLWFQVAHYCVRPWPWLLVGFVALVKYPELRANWLADPNFDPGVGFPMLMRDLLPVGLRGLLLVAFFAAFMSTLATQINWGASYLVSDFYKRFFAPNADQRHLAWASRLASLIVLTLGGIAAYKMRSISVDNAWKLLAALGAGTGAVFMLRWFWWRINAWSEISAMVASLVYFLIVRGLVKTGEYQTAIVAGLTVPTWLIFTYLTPAESRQTLLNFYRKVRPGGPGWASIAAEAPEVKPDRNLGASFGAALCGVGLILTVLPGVGFLIFGAYGKFAMCAVGAIACGIGISALLNKAGWKEVAR